MSPAEWAFDKKAEDIVLHGSGQHSIDCLMTAVKRGVLLEAFRSIRSYVSEHDTTMNKMTARPIHANFPAIATRTVC